MACFVYLNEEDDVDLTRDCSEMRDDMRLHVGLKRVDLKGSIIDI